MLRCLLIGVHMMTLRCVTFVQCQHGTRAYNNTLQLPFLRRSNMFPAFAARQAREGNYHMYEFTGATEHKDFQVTVRKHPSEHSMSNCAILTMHLAQREDGTWQGAQHVAAVLMPLRTDVPEWFV